MKLFPYQVEGVKALISHRRWGLFDEMGLGKTVQAFYACKKLNLRKVLIICPASLAANHEKEWTAWHGDHRRLLIVSWNFIQKETNAAYLAKKGPWECVIADESQRLGKPSSAQSRHFLHYIAPNTKRYWLLSGTPATNSAADFWLQLSLLLPGKVGTFGAWKKRHTYRRKVGRGKYTRVRREGFKNTKRINKLLKLCSTRRTLDQAQIDLPPIRFSNLYLDLDNYDMEEPPDIDPDSDEPPESIVPYLRELGLNKAKEAMDYIKGTNQPTVIFYWFTDCKKYLLENLTKKFRVGVISGKESKTKKQKYIDQFQAGKLDYLVCNYIAGGIGHTFTKSRLGICLELPWSAVDYIQAYKRLHRISQQKSVHIVNCIAQGTFDDRILRKLKSKSRGLRMSLDGR